MNNKHYDVAFRCKNHKLKTQKRKKNLRLWLKFLVKFIMTHFIPWAVRFTENSVRPAESDVGTGHAQKNR
jgi:hypothetical protein